jgi:hypothetical protein
MGSTPHHGEVGDRAETKVARWHIFKTEIPIGVNFGGSCNGRCWYILGPFWSDVYMYLQPFVIFCGHLLYFVAICYILWSFGIFCGHLVYFVAIYILWFFIYIFDPISGRLYQEKSGNPG